MGLPPRCPLCCCESETYPEPGYLSCLSCHFIAARDEWHLVAEQAAKARAFDRFTTAGGLRDVHAELFLAEERARGGLT